MTRVLIVDDDLVQLRLTSEVAVRAGFIPLTATGGEEALSLLRSEPGIAAMVLDLVMPDLDGMAVMEAMRRESLSVPVIVQTAQSSLETVTTAMRQGAVDFFVKPVAPERLMISLRNAMKLGELETLVRTDLGRRSGSPGIGDILTAVPAMDRVLQIAAKAARAPVPVLIEGESGVGKELLARVIHGGSERAGKPFVTFDCSAYPAGALEAALFGQRKGVGGDQPGKFTEAQGGTLFLKEIGELPAETQGKLLAALEQGSIQPPGAARPERINVRLIAGTRRRLLNLARNGGFREDLYYRLTVLPVYVPPLRERRDDIPLLAAHFLARFAAEAGRRIVGISDAALDLLRVHDWPGNVRQLQNAIYRAVVLTDGAYLQVSDFPQIVAQSAGRAEALKLTGTLASPSAPVHIDDAIVALHRQSEREAVPDRFLTAAGEVTALNDVERELIAFALRHYGFHMSRVARALGIGRSTLYRKLKDYGLDEALETDAA